jgi:hypothetical protein
MDRSRIRKLSNFDMPLIISIRLVLRYNYFKFNPSRPEISSILFYEMSSISRLGFLFMPSIVTIEFALRFKILRYLFRERSLILAMLLLLTSRESKCNGGYFTSNIVVSSLLVAFTLIKYFSPERYLSDFSLL